jgi:hypothetical protein
MRREEIPTMVVGTDLQVSGFLDKRSIYESLETSTILAITLAVYTINLWNRKILTTPCEYITSLEK